MWSKHLVFDRISPLNVNYRTLNIKYKSVLIEEFGIMRRKDESILTFTLVIEN